MILATLWISIKASLLNGVGFIRFLNVNLAILNLLPIPVLDGGHVLFAVWEAIFRRPAHPKVVTALVNVFASLLIAVFILLTYRDVLRVPSLMRAFGKIRAAEQNAKDAASAERNGKQASSNNATGDMGSKHEPTNGNTNKAAP
jgi:regulator of sigma E protease